MEWESGTERGGKDGEEGMDGEREGTTEREGGTEKKGRTRREGRTGRFRCVRKKRIKEPPNKQNTNSSIKGVVAFIYIIY